MRTRLWRFFAAFIALPIALAAVPRPTPYVQSQVVDGGTFTLYLNGGRIGEERFLIRGEPAGSAGPVYRAGAELNLKLDGRTMRVSVAVETIGARCRPRRYEIQINGPETITITGSLARERMRLDIRSAEGDEMKEFLVRGQAAILERHIAHHYFFAAKLLGNAASGELVLIVPSQRLQQRAVIEDRGTEGVRIGERELMLRHLAIVTETRTTHHVWLDGDRVMKVDVPEEGFLAVRSDIPDQATR
ncbi:MAG: hypothetical protein AMS25_10905 [Gemmatimonas sp. SM23_52]|nr:MAG: hypothetical protein AMS25_10905 [Gemmatimonas sp. SM23_52]